MIGPWIILIPQPPWICLCSKAFVAYSAIILTGENIDGSALFRYLTGKVLMDGIKTMH